VVERTIVRSPRLWEGRACPGWWIPEAVYAAPPPSGSGIIDARLAAVAEKLTDEASLPRPSWTAFVPPAEPPFAPPARRRGEIPSQLEQRGLLIDGESLFRPKDRLGV